MAPQGEPQVQFKLPPSGLPGSSSETLIWSLLPRLLLPHLRWSWAQLWQHSMTLGLKACTTTARLHDFL
uniref:Uncharacterized protein n=1 Tax=Peromyscus maniculatus bairdii TaxID=230844 RepID=A0A8C8UIQ0_PERMB